MKNAFMIAATGSGCGKTTITCSLLKALKEKGLKIRSYKCGPDYIDPMFHKTVLGIEAKNLDLFFSNEEELRALFYTEADHDLSLVEGVMGLYDGLSAKSNDGSSYDLACKLDIPVVLVVDAHGMGRSLLALIRGFQDMDTEHRIKAILFNRISPMYYETIRGLVEAELGVKVIGYFPKRDDLHIESRYLGLKLPGEMENLEKDMQAAADILSKSVDLDALLDLTSTKYNGCSKYSKYHDNCIGQNTFCMENRGTKPVTIGIAKDAAFCFYYEENLKLLQQLGAKLVEFSPMEDKELPAGLDGLILGGGYPELYAKELSCNESMRASVKKALDENMPSLAECGGFMYLHDIIKVNGVDYPMVGAIDGTCEKQKHLVRFGYMTIQEKEENFLPAGSGCIKGHEFHYFDSSNNGACAIEVKPSTGKSFEAAHITAIHWWGFAHLYYPSNREFAAAFVEKCRIWREQHE